MYKSFIYLDSNHGKKEVDTGHQCPGIRVVLEIFDRYFIEIMTFAEHINLTDK